MAASKKVFALLMDQSLHTYTYLYVVASCSKKRMDADVYCVTEIDSFVFILLFWVAYTYVHLYIVF